MESFVDLMLAPLVACVVLTGIHTYLGQHVIERGVIFVDLALAQVAALGATTAFLFGFEIHSLGGYLFSLAFALLGAVVFALSRVRREIVPQEAIIGVVYAVAGAASILVLSRAPAGAEELRALMVGHLLLVNWHEIVKVAILYACVALIHWRFRKEFFAITRDAQQAEMKGISVRGWDLLFYATFAVVVTSSVELAGVLLVFCFLVVPAACGILLASTLQARLMVGWGVGVLASVLGLLLSYFGDFPTGAAIACVLGLTLLVVGALRSLVQREVA